MKTPMMRMEQGSLATNKWWAPFVHMDTSLMEVSYEWLLGKAIKLKTGTLGRLFELATLRYLIEYD